MLRNCFLGFFFVFYRAEGRGSGKTSAHVPVSCQWLNDLLAMPDSIPISHFTFITVQAVPHSSGGPICLSPSLSLHIAVRLQSDSTLLFGLWSGVVIMALGVILYGSQLAKYLQQMLYKSLPISFCVHQVDNRWHSPGFQTQISHFCISILTQSSQDSWASICTNISRWNDEMRKFHLNGATWIWIAWIICKCFEVVSVCFLTAMKAFLFFYIPKK